MKGTKGKNENTKMKTNKKGQIGKSSCWPVAALWPLTLIRKGATCKRDCHLYKSNDHKTSPNLVALDASSLGAVLQPCRNPRRVDVNAVIEPFHDVILIVRPAVCHCGPRRHLQRVECFIQ